MGIGKHFDVFKSKYRNVSLDSSENINTTIDSVPNTVTAFVEKAYGSISPASRITIRGLQPSTQYYKYQDDYHKVVSLTTDSAGNLSWNQDISSPHLFFIQTQKSTTFISDNATGGDCTQIGIWNASTKTCTLTSDVSGTIEIDSSNITLDGNGHALMGSWTGNGVYFADQSYITVKNLTIRSFSFAIYSYRSDHATITANRFTDVGYGMRLADSDRNTIGDNAFDDYIHTGVDIRPFSLLNSVNNEVSGNTFLPRAGQAAGGVFVYGKSGSSTHGADGTAVSGNTITGDTVDSWGIIFYDGSNSTVTDNTVTYGTKGLSIEYDSPAMGLGGITMQENTVGNTIVWNDTYAGLYLKYAAADTIVNNNFINNARQVQSISSSVSLDSPKPVGGNYWSDFDATAGGCTDADSDGICDAPYRIRDYNGNSTYDQYDNLPWTHQDGWKNPGKTIKVAVILAEPASGKVFTHPDYETNIFPAIRDKVTDYWCEVSFGKRDPITKACGEGQVKLEFQAFTGNGHPYRLDKDWAFYAHNPLLGLNLDLDGDGVMDIKGASDRTQQFAYDAIVKASSDIAASGFTADIAAVIFPGRREALDPGGGELNDRLGAYAYGKSGIASVGRWIIVSEEDRLLAWAYELGHQVGLDINNVLICDLYADSKCREYRGDVGDWDLMGGTPARALSNIDPSHPSSFTKIKLGWLREEVINFGRYVVESLSTLALHAPVNRFNVASDAYYLLEARSTNAAYSVYDQNAPGTGAVIYRVRSKTIDIGGTPKAIEFVNVAAELGINGAVVRLWDRVRFDVVGSRALPSKFEVDVSIGDASASHYIGIMLNATLDFLGRILPFVGPDNNLAPGVYSFTLTEILWLNWLWVISFIITISTVFMALCWTKQRRKVIFVGFAIAIVAAFGGHYWQYNFNDFVSAVLSRILPEPSQPPGVVGPFPLAGAASVPDLDLHAITPDGNHVGMNYNTGVYENQIPGAITSGDLVYDDEWIFVPEGMQVRYYVSSHDIRQFLDANPDIAQQLPSTEEQYNLSAVYYDSQSNKFTAPPIENISIDPGKEESYVISGTSTITIVPVTDAAAPTTTISLSGTLGKNNWYTSNVQITLTATDEDDGSGVAKTEDSLDGGQTWFTYITPFTLSAEGIRTLLYRSQDKAGNVEQIKTAVIKIDKTPPESSFFFDPDKKQMRLAGTDNLSSVQATQNNADLSLEDESGHTLRLTLGVPPGSGTGKERDDGPIRDLNLKSEGLAANVSNILNSIRSRFTSDKLALEDDKLIHEGDKGDSAGLGFAPSLNRITLKTLQYDSQKPIQLPQNTFQASYTTDKNNNFTSLIQQLNVFGGVIGGTVSSGLQFSVQAQYRPKTNDTVVTVIRGAAKTTQTLPGIQIVQLLTKNDSLDFAITPQNQLPQGGIFLQQIRPPIPTPKEDWDRDLPQERGGLTQISNGIEWLTKAIKGIFAW